MKIYDILHKYAVSEIQDYLAGMDWANREYKGEQLNIFLKGLAYALWDRGFTFELRSEQENYNMVFRVEIHKYTDPADCWSGKEHLFNIFANRIEEL